MVGVCFLNFMANLSFFENCLLKQLLLMEGIIFIGIQASGKTKENKAKL